MIMRHSTLVLRFAYRLLAGGCVTLLLITLLGVVPQGAHPSATFEPSIPPTVAMTTTSQTVPITQGTPMSHNTRRTYLPSVLCDMKSNGTPVVQQSTGAINSRCTVYQNIRVTWYELNSCCNKTPEHPAYGITRSGAAVQWGMAAVQAEQPLVPLGTRIIVKDLGDDYWFIVTDTGSETAFGREWLDLYAPDKAVGHWLERQIGLDGRSDIIVCEELGIE